MILKLYRNCILNSSYSEVFRTRELVESYLGSLTSVEIIDDETIYPQKRDTINLEYTEDLFSQYTNIYNANYITIENDSQLNLPKLYAFIDKVDISNGIITLTYSEDSWTQYLPYWSIRTAVMTNCLRVNDYQVDDYEVPLPYVSNSITITTPKEYTQATDCQLVVELQLYKLSSSLLDRTPESSIIIKGIIGYQYYNGDNIHFNFDLLKNNFLLNTSLQGVINEITKKQSTETISYGSDTDWHYTLLNCYLVQNLSTNNVVDINKNTILYSYNEQVAEELTYTRICHLYGFKDNLVDYDYLSTTIEYNRLNINMGYMTHRFPIKNNGKNISVVVKMIFNSAHISFFIKYQNTYEDITEDFKYSPDISYISASDFQQRKLNDTLKLIGGISSLAIGTSNLTGGLATTMSSVFDYGLLPTDTKKLNQQLTAGGQAVSGITQMVNGVANMAVALENKYNDTMLPLNKFQNSYINTIYGFMVFRINTAGYTNYNEVEAFLTETGYSVNKIITELKSSLSGGATYDIIKLSFIRLNGVNTEINNIIETILKNGTKIWYSTNVG